jgi:NADH dehydrogenase
MTREPRVLIVGAGYAGVAAAKRLARGDARVTVLNPRAEFVERIRLHQLMAGNRAASLPLRELLPAGTDLVLGAAEAIDAGRRTVRITGGGPELDYDYLIYAVGSRCRTDLIPGAAEHATTVGDLDGALAARDRFAALPDGAAVTVIGGGLTGVEVATELAETGRARVRLVTDRELAPSVGDGGRDHLRRFFTRAGIELIEDTKVVEVGVSGVVLADGGTLPSDLTVLTTAFEVPELARASGLPVAASGALRVDESLACDGAPGVVGAGDATLVGARGLRMSCQAAIPMGTHAAETVLALAAGTAPRPVRTRFTGQCISLGRRAALWQRSNAADVPTSFTLTGRPGALLKEQICASTIRLALNPRRGWVSYSWS